MSNVRGEQPLPLDVPEQPTERFRVKVIPGLSLWCVWDMARDEAVRFPAFPSGVFYVRDRAQGYADNLNGLGTHLSEVYRLAFATMFDIRNKS